MDGFFTNKTPAFNHNTCLGKKPPRCESGESMFKAEDISIGRNCRHLRVVVAAVAVDNRILAWAKMEGHGSFIDAVAPIN